MKKIKKNKGVVIWLTGLPCSGKSTIAKELEKCFKRKRMPVQRLDGDILRKTICKDLGFSKRDRNKNIERVAYLSKMLSENGVNVVAAFVSPYRKMRNFARKICPNFIEVYLKCDLEECMRRDLKGMYRKALMGKIKNFTGIQGVYEEPKNADILINTKEKNIKDSLNLIKKLIEK